jgi:hypothetical protein
MKQILRKIGAGDRKIFKRMQKKLDFSGLACYADNG